MTRSCLSRKEGGGTLVRCFSSWMEAPRSRVPTGLVVASALLATAMQSSADIAKSFPAAREYEGVIVTAWQAPVLQTKATDRLDLFRRKDGAWEQIPFQIDERKPGHLISADSVGVCGPPPINRNFDNCSSVHVVRTHPATPSSLPDPDGTFNDADELVFLAQDLGDQASPSEAKPASSVGFESTFQEISIRDPITDGIGYVYAFVHTGTGFGLSSRIYARYEVPATCAVTPLAACGTAKAHPSGVTSSTWYWRAAWSGNWRLDQIEINGGASDLIDRWKGRATPGSETENNWDTVGCPLFRGYSSGPVRVVRCIQGSQSGVTNVKCEYVYPRYLDMEIEWRTHDIDDFKIYFDYRIAASPLGNRLAVDFSGYSPVSNEDSVDGTPVPPPTNLAPAWNEWLRVKNTVQGVVELSREGPEQVKTKCSVNEQCTGEDRVRSYLDNSGTDDGTTSEGPSESGAYGNIFLTYTNLLDGQDRNCTTDIRFGRIWRRLVFFNGTDATAPVGGIDTDVKTAVYRSHYQFENQLIISGQQLPGGGGAPCLDVIWNASNDTSGEFSQISISQDCTPPPYGWLLYRRLQSQSSLKMVGALPTNVTYKDREVKRGSTYKYALRAIGASGALGAFTSEKTVTITDTSSPLPPGTIQAVGASGSISLSWGEAGSSDSFRYNVYAAAVAGGPYTKLTPQPIEPRSFIVTNLAAGQWRYAVVSAVDTSGNEGGYSQEVSAQAQ